MSMYNCFSNASMASGRFETNNSVFDANSDEYTIFVVPVRYNQKYTIAIDWHGTIEMCCGYYLNGNVSSSALSENQSSNGDKIRLNTYYKASEPRFNHPFVFDKLVDNSNFVNDYACEKYFKLFLKVPLSCKSSIVVLEGDYTRDAELMLSKGNLVINREDDMYLDAELEYLSRPQLLSMNYQKSCLLADRMIEYLSNNVITPIDPVINNIVRLQQKVKAEYQIDFDYEGIWDDNKLRNFLYTYIIDNGLTNKYYDLLSYLDKDIEGNGRKGFDIEYIITGYEVDEKGNKKAIKKENNEWLIV